MRFFAIWRCGFFPRSVILLRLGGRPVCGRILRGGVLLAVALYSADRRQAGMGMGDVRLAGSYWRLCGVWPALPFVILVASLSASLIGVPFLLAKAVC